jgi:hypothetical protein
MESHPILLSSGMTLYSGIREFKGVGGLDSVGNSIYLFYLFYSN